MILAQRLDKRRLAGDVDRFQSVGALEHPAVAEPAVHELVGPPCGPSRGRVGEHGARRPPRASRKPRADKIERRVQVQHEPVEHVGAGILAEDIARDAARFLGDPRQP